MNKKLMCALAGIGMGLGLATSATASSGEICEVARVYAEQYCAADPFSSLCRKWTSVVVACGLD